MITSCFVLLQYTFCSYGRCFFSVSITSCKMAVTETLSWGQLWNRWTKVSFSSGEFASDLVKATVMCQGMLRLANQSHCDSRNFAWQEFHDPVHDYKILMTNNAEWRLRASNTSYFAWSWLTVRNWWAYHAQISFSACFTKQLIGPFIRGKIRRELSV